MDTAPKEVKRGKKYYYICHRSFKERKTGKNIRKEKSQGTNKIDLACPSVLTVLDTGTEALMQFYKTHAGHEIEMGRTHISNEKREEFAGVV